MAKKSHLVHQLGLRGIDDRVASRVQSRFHVTDAFIQRLGLEAELEGHTGCVNCLEWNERGNILASASDDVRFILWDPFRHKRLHSFETGHRGNIFTVKFLPKTKDNTIVTGAADCKIRVHEVDMKETTMVCSCHSGRVKRIATAPDVPYLFWSAAEDGIIMQFDLRSPHSCSAETNNILINFVPHLGRFAEAKCLAINPRRPELLAVGANDPYVRLYDRRMIRPVSVTFPTDLSGSAYWERMQYISAKVECKLAEGCVQYFVAGHLPVKQRDYKMKYRNLASTYVTFSANGSELLVNLGGEQIYLFDINNKRKPITYDLHFKDIDSCSSLKKTNGYKNGCGTSSNVQLPPRNVQYPAKVEAFKIDANTAFEARHYTSAIRLYNKAINVCPNWALLYGNKAAAYMKRGWDGDVYAALRDCNTALKLDPDHLKAHFRLAKCLFELKFTEEASKCLSEFKIKFPDEAHGRACRALDLDIQTCMAQLKQPVEQSDTDEEGEQKESTESRTARASTPKDSPQLSLQEKKWRENGYDYELRYCGHCNTTTDIKEANFFGSDGQYIVAGSDDGSFFIWDRHTTNIVQVIKGDDSIVNCLQPHPTYCLLATSGIDPVVRLWSPRPEDGTKNDRTVLNLDDAASANQKRMNADPFEVMLMNMGYRIAASVNEGEQDLPEDSTWTAPPINCRQS